MSEELVRARIRESVEAKQRLAEDVHVRFVLDCAELLAESLRDGGKVILCGNGGSSADATHLAAELLGRFKYDRDPLPAFSLTDNTASITAIANDVGYERAFSRQVRGLGSEGDVLIALSTSGTSPNVIDAVEVARSMGMRTVGMTGAGGGRLPELCDVCLRVPSDDTARIQEGYMLAAHTVCELVERTLFPPDA
ncbi:MAG: D-sedoheptulose 7-phosphate isomerase [Actinomycetota bacterium]|nr:D-sedoheptulose 7-phosphate isomerase [Actinomycetota bacterium]